eukprot:RCo012009
MLPPSKRTLQLYTLYETKLKFYLVASDLGCQRFRVLKIDRDPADVLSVSADPVEYSSGQIRDLLATVEAAYRGKGGLSKRLAGYGILGFIRFTRGYYLILITDRRRACSIGPHVVYEITGTEMVPLDPAAGRARGFTSSFHKDDEVRYCEMFQSFEVSKNDFYFSYSTYDITHTLQWNVGQQAKRMAEGEPKAADGRPLCSWDSLNQMFVWNSFLLGEFQRLLGAEDQYWVLPVTHGFFGQSTIHCYGKLLNLIVIARRSKQFAGTRYLKRGINDLGFVANHAETEQIVYDGTSSMAHRGAGLFTSFVQVRGSVPVFWHQTVDKVPNPKPNIQLGKFDPVHSASRMHLQQLFQAYGTPLIALDLLKQNEKNPRESPLSRTYREVVEYFNSQLPEELRIQFLPWDFRAACKTKAEKVINDMTAIAELCLHRTGFFATRSTSGRTG